MEVETAHEIPTDGPRIRFAEFDDLEDMLTDYRWWYECDPERETSRPVAPFDPVEAEAAWRASREAERALAVRTRATWCVRQLSDNALIGRVSFHNLNVRNRAAEIGYRIGPPFRRQGYATEAVVQLLSHLFEARGLNRVAATTGSFNTASVALLERLGFVLEGRMRQHHELHGVLHDGLLYSMLAEEWGRR